MVWPAPHAATLRIRTADSRLLLPLRQAREEPVMSLGEPEGAPGLRKTELRPPSGRRVIEQDAASGRVTLRTYDDFGQIRYSAHGLEEGSEGEQAFAIEPEDPLSAQVEATWRFTHGRGGWQTRTETHTIMWSDHETFYLQAKLEAFEGDTLVHSKTWDEAIPRDLV